MDDMSFLGDATSGSIRSPWVWVIEYLAKSTSDIEALYEVFGIASDLPADLGNGANEMVAFRCLEYLCDPHQGQTQEAPSDTNPEKIELDLSQSCSDVLQRILEEVPLSDLNPGAPQLAKWNILPFILHKRECLPKCFLEKLKDAIIEGRDPFPESVRRRSGLIRFSEQERNATDKNESDVEVFVDGLACMHSPNREVNLINPGSGISKAHHIERTCAQNSGTDVQATGLASPHAPNREGCSVTPGPSTSKAHHIGRACNENHEPDVRATGLASLHAPNREGDSMTPGFDMGRTDDIEAMEADEDVTEHHPKGGAEAMEADEDVTVTEHHPKGGAEGMEADEDVTVTEHHPKGGVEAMEADEDVTVTEHHPKGVASADVAGRDKNSYRESFHRAQRLYAKATSEYVESKRQADIARRKLTKFLILLSSRSHQA